MTASYFTIANDQRTQGDCMRIAVAIAHNLEYGDTPALDADNADGQIKAWHNWAAIRRLAWYISDTHAPIGAVRWIAIVDSPSGPASHAVAMQGDRILADPANLYTSIKSSDVRLSWMLLPAGSPIFNNAGLVRWAPLIRPYRPSATATG